MSIPSVNFDQIRVNAEQEYTRLLQKFYPEDDQREIRSMQKFLPQELALVDLAAKGKEASDPQELRHFIEELLRHKSHGVLWHRMPMLLTMLEQYRDKIQEVVSKPSIQFDLAEFDELIKDIHDCIEHVQGFMAATFTHLADSIIPLNKVKELINESKS